MNKVLTVAVREFIETTRTRTFFFSSVLVPLLMVGLILGSQSIEEVASQEQEPLRTVAVVDHTGAVVPPLLEFAEQSNAASPNRPLAFEEVDAGPDVVADLQERVNAGALYAYVVIPADVMQVGLGEPPPATQSRPAPASRPASEAGQPAEAPVEPTGPSLEVGRKDSQPEIGNRLRRLVNEAIVAARFAAADPPVDPKRIARLQQTVPVRSVDVVTGQETTGDELIRLMTPFAFMFLLFMGTMTISQGLLTSVIEEKSSRVVEVLLSAVSPLQLMAGKILGMVGVGVLLLIVWGGVGYGSAQARGLDYLVTPERLGYLVLFFIPGFLLYASTLAAIGAACNTIKEAQSMAAPLTIVTIVPLMLWWLISFNPNSALSITLSFIPPITPFVMILRVCADPHLPIWQVLATLTLLWLSVLATIWAAGRIFRIGVLMYGKAPSPRELLRWLSYE